MAAASHFHERRDGLLPTGRSKIKTDPPVSRSAVGIPEPGFYHHQKPPRDARHGRAVRTGEVSGGAVWLSITTLDNELRKVMEPRTSPPAARLAAIRELAEAGIPMGVNVAPVIPGLTDHEMPAILQAARTPARLPPDSRWCACRTPRAAV